MVEYWERIDKPHEVASFPCVIVVDLEATCSDDGAVPREEMEIIEIGAVAVETSSFEPVDEFQTFVTPFRHPKLTGFCHSLTGISQDMLAGAPEFGEALNGFTDWFGQHEPEIAIASWGAYDRNQFLQDCAFHEVNAKMPPHANLKTMFSRRQNTRSRFGMAGALKACKLGLKGDHHRALDDAKNIARLLPWIVGDKKI